jgi:excisionase family DNA binding protein
MNMNEVPSGVEQGSTAGGEPFIGKREVARRLGKTVRTVDNWMRRGILPFYKCGHTVTFRWTDVQLYLKENFLVCRRAAKQR